MGTRPGPASRWPIVRLRPYALALRSKAPVITGGPGVGKTTVVKTILRIAAGRRP